jgi:pyruvate/2-oxoglutarate dehydrogenase complex dihydrolipoamide dehydrogenase (E3) component
MDPFDAIVLGTGQAGKPLAITLAKAGWRVAVIERDAVGGSCVNFGCTPTKTMVASARVAYLARRAADFGVVTGAVAVDLAAVRRRKEAEASAGSAATMSSSTPAPARPSRPFRDWRTSRSSTTPR